MLQFAAPLGLLALASLVVPIALHLIRRPRQTVHVGSLRFLAAQRRRLDSIRWRDRLLLVVRCLLLAALALLIAGTSWQPTDTTPARWLLLAPGAGLDPAQQAEWNRLRSAGFAPHHLAPGFDSAESTPATVPAGFDAWSLLRELDSRLPAGSQAHVFGPTPAEWFAGARPELSHLQVTWTRTAAAAPATPPVPSAAEPARIAVIASPDRADDARYLRAAIAATGAIETRANPNWIFLLGTAEVPADLSGQTQRDTVLVRDAAATLAARPVSRTFTAAATTLRLRQRASPANGIPLLTDSTGEALLVEQRTGPRREWHWALRFHPDWTDWPTGGAFPAWWRDHWAPRPVTGLSLAPEQAAPGFNASAVSAPTPIANPTRTIDLRPFCWALALALFVLEFWLRRRRPTAPPA